MVPHPAAHKLGHKASSVTDRRVRRHLLREFLNEHSSIPRVRRCSYRLAHNASGAGIAVADGVAHFRGLQLCGSIHSCPVCAAKIREGRAGEINRAAVAHLEQGGGLEFVSLTVPHDQGDRLAHLIDVIADGWRRIWQGRAGQGRRTAFGIEGYVRSLDVTHGGSGWHPHLHVLLFTVSPLSVYERRALHLELLAVWRSWAVAHGLRSPSVAHGVDVRPVRTRAELGGYLAKVEGERWHVGRELARGDAKRGTSGGRTPWEILGAACDNGDADDLALWHEYEAATMGRRAITWSRGLKDRYRIEDVEDQELADAEVGGQLVAVIPAELWRHVRRVRGLRRRLLEAAEVGGLWAVRDAVSDSLGHEWAVWVVDPPDEHYGEG